MKDFDEEIQPRVILITGTDTGVGKTFVGCAIAGSLTSQGVRVAAVKPVETGVGPEPSDVEDGVRLALATGQDHPSRALTCLKAPLAPPVAADLEGVTLEMETWVSEVERLSQINDVVLVEGAGGLLAPLTWKESVRELAVKLNAEAILVVGNRLGCVNHTLLTMEALERSGIPLPCVILNAIGAEDESVGRNFGTLQKYIGLRHLYSVPHFQDSEDAAQSMSEVCQWVLGQIPF